MAGSHAKCVVFRSAGKRERRGRFAPDTWLKLAAFAAAFSDQGVNSPAFAQITVTNAGSAVGLVGSNLPDTTCIPPGQYWMTGGLAVGDFNNDGFPDVFVVGGGFAADKLFINGGNGTFTNQAAAWGVAAFHGGSGAAVGDYNNDGWLDLYVTSFGAAGQAGQPGKHKLYRNNGNGTFTNVAVAAGVNFSTTNVPSAFGAAWGDYDLDGDLDLFVAAWKDVTGVGNNGTGNRLYHNNGDSTFTNVTTTALGNAMAGVWGFQPAFVDMNGDLFPEILLAADFGTSRYLVNNRDGTFTDATAASGTGLDWEGMGQTVADIDNDGLLDWYVTSVHMDVPPNRDVNVGNMLYMNLGNDSFLEQSHRAGVNDGGWGWGTLAVDLDRDGWVDLVEVNGRNAAEWANEREYIFRNNGNSTFTEVGESAGLDLAGDGRSVVWLDADRDGDQDFLISVNASAMRYYRNDTVSAGHWISISFNTATDSRLAPNGFGTRVKVTAGQQVHVGYLSGSPSYLGTSELALYFGLGGAAVIDELKIYWTRGTITTLHAVPVNQFLNVIAPIPADINGDGVVGPFDLAQLLASWGVCPTPCAADIAPIGAPDGNVGPGDLGELLSQWGTNS